MSKIIHIFAREILDSRGQPTVSAEIITDSQVRSEAFVPSGASTGEHEALELRDGDPKRYNGKGVLKACANVNGPIQKLLIGQSVLDQSYIDNLMINADGTENKERFGANAILSVSLAVAKAAAIVSRMPLYAYLAGIGLEGKATTLPIPMLNIMNGGAHADNSLEFQEFMIRPIGASSFSEAIRAGSEVFQTLKVILKKRGYPTSVGDEGGFAPNLSSHEEALSLISEAIEKAGYRCGKDITLALDCAASEIFDSVSSLYIEKKKKMKGETFISRTSEEQISYLEKLVSNFSIDSIEDGLAENDWKGWTMLTKALGSKLQIVCDDILVTNVKFLKRAIQENIGNAILIKPNQIGTLTETLQTIKLAQENNYKTIISHRSGETEDSFIADLAVATNAGQIKTGAPCRSDRVSKYNRLIYIEDELKRNAKYG